MDYPTKPYLLFTDPDDIESRICVSRCPYDRAWRKSSQKMVEQEMRIGKICSFEDKRIRRIVDYDANRNTRKTFFNVWDSAVLATGLSVGIGLVYLIFVQWLPAFMNYVAVFGGGLSSIILSIILYNKFPVLQHQQ